MYEFGGCSLNGSPPRHSSPTTNPLDKLEVLAENRLSLSHLPPWIANDELYDHVSIPTLRDHLKTHLDNSTILPEQYFLDRDHLTLRHINNLTL